MPLKFEKDKLDIIDKVIAEINKKLPAKQATLVAEFARQFYGTVALDDLQAHSIDDLYGALLSHWNFAQKRKPNELKIRVYNPDYEQHGWQSTHTIIEIINDDMPFLVDSTRMEINRQGFTPHLMVHLGGMKVKRNGKHEITEIFSIDTQVEKDVIVEAPIYVEVNRHTDPQTLERLKSGLMNVLGDVRVVVEDWQKMRSTIRDSLTDLDKVKDHLDADELAETKDFLRWIEDHHFTFLGVRDYELVGKGKEQALKIIPGTGLGVLRDTEETKEARSLASMTPEARELTLSSQILIISETNTQSTVHRPKYTDYIGIKRFNEKGDVTGERRIVGLYTSAAYNTNPKHIPFLRRKVAAIIKNSKMGPKSHAGKVLLNILETLPRDDLFQANGEDLLEMSLGIFHLQERRRIRIFVRKDVYGRFISCLVYVPRERFNTELREVMQEALQEFFNAHEVSFSTRFSDSVLARIHFILRIEPGQAVEYDLQEIENRLIDIGRSWQDELCENLVDYYGEEKGNQLVNRYVNTFPAGYIETFTPMSAVYDIKHIENLSDACPLEMNLYKPIDEPAGNFRFKVYQRENTIPLSDVLPILENMGLRIISEEPYQIIYKDNSCVWINNFGMVYSEGGINQIDVIKEKFQDAFANFWTGRAESDNFNRLVLGARLSWREITVLRAYAKYLRQTGFTFSQSYIEETFSEYRNIASGLITLFRKRFEPDSKASSAEVKQLVKDLQLAMDSVDNLDDDRILRRYLDVIMATLRTNYFQVDADGNPSAYLSFKLDPAKIPELPLPRPMFEIFVYSPRFEGVHLRGGKVARGGLRWSDRREDFRTEILGLMKAQQVKNAVIVPTGAKGGFVAKQLPTNGSRDEIMAEGIACYKDFIRGMLDITDNQKGGEVIHPDNVIFYDKEDPYLVVAADKGTATFSDIANGISAEYDFWMGDAFASGGSAGYDHKKMGITARGAWESVKRHFRELGVNTQTTDFTVVGIGDMAGDVFGNGMLLSEHIQLVAAFNHMHIFLDPNPDSAKSFQERKRLFEMPRSAWSDYSANLISKGGGVFERRAKSIKLSFEVKKLLGLKQDIIEPNKLINAILKAPVDLLWNGGIGTYVKGDFETHSDVGDRTNDNVRINASELRCKVIGEGGNLGFTQQARVEYALKGGMAYSDFIDNSGGVDCSDHEVNIKILLNDIVARSDITLKQRNTLLAKMTDEVANLVLHNNYRQTQAISLAAAQADRNIELHSRYMQDLERKGKLDRSLEFLPDEQALTERKLIGKGLAKPGIAVLLAYSKILLKESIINSDVPEDPYLSNFLEREFPEPLIKKYRKEMEHHNLRREIIATQLSNNLINEMGFTFIYRLNDETGAPVSTIVRAYTVARFVFDLDHVWEGIEALDNKITSQMQISMMMQLIRLMRRATRWFLRNRRTHLDIESAINDYKPGVVELKQKLSELLIGADKKTFDEAITQHTDAGVPESLATALASTRAMFSALDIVESAKECGVSNSELGAVYFMIGERLDLGWIRQQVIAYQVENHWEALTREALRDDLDWQQRQLSLGILKHPRESKNVAEHIENWLEDYNLLALRWKTMITELRSSSSLNLTMIFVAIRELLDLTQTSSQAISNDSTADKLASKQGSGDRKKSDTNRAA